MTYAHGARWAALPGTLAALTLALGACSGGGSSASASDQSNGGSGPTGSAAAGPGGATASSSASSSAGSGGGGAAGDPCGKGSTLDFQDSFDDSKVGPEWAPFSGNGTTVSETMQELVISSHGYGGNWAGYLWDAKAQGTRSLLACHLSVEVPAVLSQKEAATVDFGLRGAKMGDELTFEQSAGKLSLIDLEGGVAVHHLDLSYDANAHRWWRFRELNGTTTWQTSPDGKAWVDQQSAPTPGFASAVIVSLSAGSIVDFADGEARFDNLNIDPP
jgi:hypothetical protein